MAFMLIPGAQQANDRVTDNRRIDFVRLRHTGDVNSNGGSTRCPLWKADRHGFEAGASGSFIDLLLGDSTRAVGAGALFLQCCDSDRRKAGEID